jgi:hypothetical protein
MLHSEGQQNQAFFRGLSWNGTPDLAVSATQSTIPNRQSVNRQSVNLQSVNLQSSFCNLQSNGKMPAG